MRLLPVVLLLAVPHVASAAWTTIPYDPTPLAGWTPSLRLGPGPFVDGSGIPNIAYWTPGGGFRYYDGVSSQSAQPPGAPSVPPEQVQLFNTGEAALALDNGGKPWIAEANLYSDHPQDNTLTIVHQENGSWVGEPMGRTEGLLSIEYDRLTRRVHLFHRASAGMVYAWRENGTWHTEPFGEAYGVLRLDKSGNPELAYSTANGIHYATRVGNAWQSVLVEARASTGVPVLAFNSSGRPRILYGYSVGVQPGDYFLRYATETDGVWSTEAIAAVGGSVYDYDLAMLGDTPYVALQSGNAAMFATKASGDWTVEPVDQETNYGVFPTIVIDSDDHPIVAYQASGFGARYAVGSAILSVDPHLPDARFEFAALQVPAPRGASMTLRASARSSTGARLEAFDASGRSVGPPRHVDLSAGPNLVSWSAPSKPGLVFLRLVTDEGEVAVTRAVIL